MLFSILFFGPPGYRLQFYTNRIRTSGQSLGTLNKAMLVLSLHRRSKHRPAGVWVMFVFLHPEPPPTLLSRLVSRLRCRRVSCSSQLARNLEIRCCVLSVCCSYLCNNICRPIVKQPLERPRIRWEDTLRWIVAWLAWQVGTG